MGHLDKPLFYYCPLIRWYFIVASSVTTVKYSWKFSFPSLFLSNLAMNSFTAFLLSVLYKGQREVGRERVRERGGAEGEGEREWEREVGGEREGEAGRENEIESENVSL